MGSLKDLMDTLKEAIQLIKAIFKKASQNVWTSILLVAAVGALLMASWFVYVNLQIDDLAKRGNEFLAETKLLQKEARDRRVLDYLELCIDAQKGKDSNEQYYCQDAVVLYKNAFIGMPNERLDENIRRSAYGAMKIEINVKLRESELSRQDKRLPTADTPMKFLMSVEGITLMVLTYLLVSLGVSFALYRLSAFSSRQDA